MYTMVPFRSAMKPMFPSLFNDHFMSEFFDAPAAPSLRVDVREREDAYLLEADLPGVSKDQIKLDVHDDTLTISADVNTHKKDKKDGYVYSERSYGHVERSFDLEGIDQSGIKADYENGVLMIVMPKAQPEQKQATRIQIGDHIENLPEGNNEAK